MDEGDGGSDAGNPNLNCIDLLEGITGPAMSFCVSENLFYGGLKQWKTNQADHGRR